LKRSEKRERLRRRKKDREKKRYWGELIKDFIRTRRNVSKEEICFCKLESDYFAYNASYGFNFAQDPV
jgi:hypothetical protein